MYKYKLVLFLGNPGVGEKLPLSNWKHIDVKTRFQLAGTPIKKVKESVRKIVNEFSPIKLVFGRVQIFPEDDNFVEYVSIKNDHLVRDVHEALSKEIDDIVEVKEPQYERSKFLPKLILERGVEGRVTDKFEYNGRVEEFHNVYLVKEVSRPNNEWKVLEKFQLAGE